MNGKSIFSIRRIFAILVCALPLMALALLCNSCGDDEPASKNWVYYLDIQSQYFHGFNYDDSEYGIEESMEQVKMKTLILDMKKAIREYGPIAAETGNDAPVIAACDEIFRNSQYYRNAGQSNTVCVITLTRGMTNGDRIVSSKPLKTYHLALNEVSI